jgi:AcrR family transcriptional regulator
VKLDTKQDVRNYKRSLIIEAASKLFYEKGFQKTTLDDIANSLSVTKPFIYTYFENKYAILEELFDIVYEDLYADVVKVLDQEDGAADERLVRFMHIYLAKNIERQRFTSIFMEEEKNLSASKIADVRKKQRQFDLKLTNLIETGVKQRLFAVNDAAVASLSISGMVRWAHRWYTPKGRLSVDELCAEMSELALKMVGYKVKKRSMARPQGRF